MQHKGLRQMGVNPFLCAGCNGERDFALNCGTKLQAASDVSRTTFVIDDEDKREVMAAIRRPSGCRAIDKC
jgi:hypothetical protein